MSSGTLLITVVTVTWIRQIVPPEVLEEATRHTIMVTLTLSFVALWGLGIILRRMVLLSDELKRLINRDRLTNVSTRDYFFDQMASGQHMSGVTLMVDVDHFKGINDTYGHLVGDAVLAGVAQVLSEQVRAGDIVCRFGGEEFVLFLPDACEKQAAQIAERIRAGVEAQSFRQGRHEVRATVSIGVSDPQRAADIEAAIHQADVALYQAKRTGRNQAVQAKDLGRTDDHLSLEEAV